MFEVPFARDRRWGLGGAQTIIDTLKKTDFGPGGPRLYVVPEPKFDLRGSEEGPA